MKNFPALLAYLDRNETYVYANETYTSWFKKPLEEVIGKSVTNVLGDLYEIVRVPLAKAYAGEHVEFVTIVPYAGGNRRVRATYLPDRDERTDEVQGIHIFIQEIPDFDHLDGTDKLTALLQHDLRNSLGIIKLTTQLISRKAADGDAIERFLHTIQLNTDRIERQIANIQNIYQLSLKSNFGLSPVELQSGELLQEVIDLVADLKGPVCKLLLERDEKVFWDRSIIMRIFEICLQRLSRTKSDHVVKLTSIGDWIEVSFSGEIREMKSSDYLIIVSLLLRSIGGESERHEESAEKETLTLRIPKKVLRRFRDSENTEMKTSG